MSWYWIVLGAVAALGIAFFIGLVMALPRWPG